MMERITETSLRFQARMAGVVALITTAAGFAAIVNGNLVVIDDASATAHNILTHQALFRLAVVGDVISILYVVYTLLLFNLFCAVNRDLSLLAAFFSLVGCGIGALNVMFELAPLVILGGAQSLTAFNTQQLQALALMFLKFHGQVYDLALVLFGSYNILIGYLIFRSTFMPRIVGVLLAFAGFCYLINSFATFLAPGFAAHLVPYILVPGLSELVVALWFAAIGVNVERWKRQAAVAGVTGMGSMHVQQESV